MYKGASTTTKALSYSAIGQAILNDRANTVDANDYTIDYYNETEV
jgi:hypothetical protein